MEELRRLVLAIDDALAAYYAIFGRSAWNERDRVAFGRLKAAREQAADFYNSVVDAPPRIQRVPLRRKLQERRAR